MSTSMYQVLRRDIATALGEAQSQSDWVEAGIALEVCASALQRRLAGVEFHSEELGTVRGDEFVRRMLAAPATVHG